MLVAGLAAKRSKDPSTQVGAVIVNKYNRIVSTGYNGMPRGIDNAPWGKDSEDMLQTKYAYVVHAEANAVCNWYHRGPNLRYRMYVTLHPCNECAKLIIQSGVKEVIFAKSPDMWTDNYTAAKRILVDAGVVLREYDGTRSISVEV